MDAPWHFVYNDEQQGPISAEGLVQLALQGIVDESTLVWTPGNAEWTAFGSVEALSMALLAAEEPVTKRQRVGSGAVAPSPRTQQVSAWVDSLDEASTVDLFERALFSLLEDVIHGRPALRDELLATFVQRHPESDTQDPAAYTFTDEFLLEVVEDFESREQMWECLGQDNAGVVRGVLTVAAKLDRHYCRQLQALALLSRARCLLPAGCNGTAGSTAGREQLDRRQQLVELLRQEKELALAQDMDGRSMWHDLVAGEQLDLLRLLLPVAAEAGMAGHAAVGGGKKRQQGVHEQHAQEGASGEQQHKESQQEPQQEQQQEQEQEEDSKVQNSLNLPIADGNMPLHLATETAQLEAARLLLDHGASLDMQNRKTSQYARGDWSIRCKGLDFAVPVPSLHQTPLHIAAEAGDLGMMGLLVQRGALLDLKDAAGSTPLDLVLKLQDERTVQLLLAAGANPTLTNNNMGDDNTLLHVAATAGSARILRLLLATGKLGTAVSKPGQQGFTALHLAARRGSKECVQLLLEAGADRSAKTATGKTPLDIAQVNKREAVVALLADGSADGQPAA